MVKKSQRILIILLALAMSLTLLQVSAVAAVDKIDLTRSVSLTLHYHNGITNFSNVQFSLYRVADISQYGDFTSAGDFKRYSVSFDGLNNEGWTDLASTLASYVSRDKLIALDKARTSSKGELTFTNKTPGLYLVIGAKHTSGSYTYTPQSFLVSLPNLGRDKKWEYDVTSEPKFTRKSSGGGIGGGGGGPTNPTTVQCTAIKVWADKGNEKERPDSIVAQLLRSGAVYAEVTLDESNNWRHTWSGLDEEYDWLVVEKYIPEGYTVSVSQNGTTFTVKNTYDGEEPDEPKDPKDPDEPDDPKDPKDPKDPDEPDNPRPKDPKEPDEPDKPKDPRDPDDPDDPRPKDPKDPDEPDNPRPKDPKDPDEPDNPNKPNDPKNPDNPNQPNDPRNPDNPNEPNIPNNPRNPGDPRNPDIPNNPDNPNKPPELFEEPEEPDEPTPKLPQTGMLWWPVPVMYTMGSGLFFAGYRTRRKSDEADENDNEAAC
ncbi:MAG: Cna B-type domain-containing protein [Oscillospiraceae bacterium]|nr:Cna B-type domain-containing protein [Oscillospiraceae bacterium]